MSDLATEYFENVKELKGELKSQARLVTVLKQRLVEAERKSVDAAKADVNGSSNGPSKEEIDELVKRKARKYLLKLKSDFEMRIKRKNSIIRKLQKEQAVKSSSNGSGFVTSDGQSNGADPDRNRVNHPR